MPMPMPIPIFPLPFPLSYLGAGVPGPVGSYAGISPLYRPSEFAYDAERGEDGGGGLGMGAAAMYGMPPSGGFWLMGENWPGE